MKRFSKLTMLLGIVVLCTMPAKAQWAWLNPTPQANEFFDGHAFSATEYILVGSNGAIVHTDDGGMTWNDIPNPLLGTPFNAVSVVFTDPQQGMISYANGNILRTMNGGTTWDVVVPPAKQVQYLFEGPSGAIWGSGSLGALARTTDHGMSWEEFDTGIDNVIFDIAFPSAGTIVASCGQGLIITSDNNGNSWSQQQPNLSGDIVSMEFIDAQRGFALQKSRFLLRTDDGGQSWTDTTFGVNEFRSIRFFDSQVGWVISNSIGNIYRTDDGGQSFTLIEVDTLTNYSFQNVVPVSQDVALVFGSGGSVFRTTDRGQTWEQLGGGESRENIYAVSSLSDDEAWVFGEDLALFSGDAGVSWTENRSPGTDAFRLGYALSDQRVIGAGKQGEMWLSTDAGVSWTQTATLAGAGQIEQIDFVDNLNGWVTGAHGTIARTTDGGDSWLDSDPGVTHDFFGIDARSADEAWVVGDGGVMYRTTNAGQSWDAMNSNTSANLRSIEFSSTTNGWAGGQVQVLRTTDGGTTWNRVVIPGVDFMYRIDFVDEDIGFFMTSRSILRTKDGGDTFYRTDYPALGQRDIDARASGYAWLVGDYGAVLRYTPAPVIQIIPGFSDFGQVPTNLYTERTFEVQSVGERDLDVTNFSTLGAGYTIEESTPALLPPGSSTTVRIRFTPPDTGVFRGVLSVVSDAQLGKASADLVGTGITPPPLQFSHDPTILDFGEVRLCDLAEKTVYIENVSDRNVFLDSVTVVGPDSASFMIAAPPGFIFTPGKKDSILVLCVPKRMGTLNATIIVVNRDQAEPRYPIPVTAEGINPVITPDPDEIRFGFVFVGNQDTKTLTIENTGTAPLEISNWWIGGTDSLEFEITRDPDVQVPIGGTTTLDVQWSAQEPFGGRDAMVVIESDDCLTPALEVPIQARPTSTGISRIDAVPQAYSLSQNYPNPFSVSRDAQTLYEFTLPIRATVEISMYNSLGERVKKIVSGDFTAGTYSASLDGANLEPGVYFVEMRAIAGPNAASIQRVKTVVTR